MPGIPCPYLADVLGVDRANSRLEVLTGFDLKIVNGEIKDSNGDIRRTYVYHAAEIDISGTGATVVGPVFPVAAEVLRAYAVVSEALAAELTTGTIALGTVDADGTSNGDVDAVVDEIALTASAAVGTVFALTIVEGTIAAGKCLTYTHVQQAVAGKVKLVVEYVLDL